jgi:hypothetical protein
MSAAIWLRCSISVFKLCGQREDRQGRPAILPPHEAHDTQGWKWRWRRRPVPARGGDRPDDLPELGGNCHLPLRLRDDPAGAGGR